MKKTDLFNSKNMHAFHRYAEDCLTGDWCILGGTLLYLFDRDIRVTTDIDLVPLSSARNNQSLLQSFALAEKMGVPVESINSAALFFLQKIKNFEKELVVFHEWKKGRLLRPNLFLFLQLKTARFTETDFMDCQEFLKLSLPEKDKILLKRVLLMLKKTEPKFKKQSLEWLKELIRQTESEIKDL